MGGGDLSRAGSFPISDTGIAEIGILARAWRCALQAVRTDFLPAVRFDRLAVGAGFPCCKITSISDLGEHY